MFRLFPLMFAVLALGLMLAGPVQAADDVAEGKVVKAGAGKLTFVDKDKKETTVELAKDGKVSCDGKDCKLDDLKKGVSVKVTWMKKDDKVWATKIDASTK